MVPAMVPKISPWITIRYNCPGTMVPKNNLRYVSGTASGTMVRIVNKIKGARFRLHLVPAVPEIGSGCNCLGLLGKVVPDKNCQEEP